MRVLLINNCFYRKGGSETVLFNTGKLLEKHGHEVRYFSIDDKNNQLSTNAIVVPQAKGLKKIISYFYNFTAAKFLNEMLEEWHPDIAHIHLLWGGLSPSIISVLHKHNVPVVHTAHDYRMVCPAYTFRNGRGRICEKCHKYYFQCILNKCCNESYLRSIMMALEMRFRNLFFNPTKILDGIIFVSEFSKSKHIEHNPNFRNIPHLMLYNCCEEIPFSIKHDYYLYSGRLSKEKGCKTLIEAFKRKPESILVIAGSGPEENNLKDLAANTRNISFTGRLNKEHLYKIISNCSFVIVPSEWYENNPMSAIEAYAAGKPVIGANIGGIPEILKDGGTGFLFDSGSINSLLMALDKAEATEYEPLSQNASLFSKEHTSEESYFSALIDFYMEVIQSFCAKDATIA